MQIAIHTGNHNNSPWIADTVRFLMHALQDCGHVARISHRIEPGQLNILLEAFETQHIAPLREAHVQGARFVVIGTEPITGGMFNGGMQGDSHYSDRAYWRQRFDAFGQAVRYADAVWVLAESMVADYARIVGDRPVHFLPHGHVDHFATVRQRPEAQRDIDFYFSGSLTEERRRVLERLAREHTVVCDTQTTPDYLRLDHLSRAKVCLSLRLGPANRIPSVSRMHFHLQNRSFLLHQAYELPCVLDPYVLQAPADEVVEWAQAALRLTHRRDIAEHSHARFADELPMRELLPPLLTGLGRDRTAPAMVMPALAGVSAARPLPV